MRKIIELVNISKTYYMGELSFEALKNINLEIFEGDYLAILGPSGSGKSTLMNILGCLDSPTQGDYYLENENILNFSANKMAKIRNKHIGFIFQNFQLLPRLNALENVILPLIYAKVSVKKRKQMAYDMLKKVGLEDKIYNYPNQLSGGQQQRVAIARALITDPSILLADEPTGALDQATSEEILKLFKEINNEGKTIIIITHSNEVAVHAKSTIVIRDGKVVDICS